MASEDRPRVLVVGGYGQVGARIADTLAPESTAIVAGRDPRRAAETAGRIGHAAEGRRVDLRDEDAAEILAGARLAVVCVDQGDLRFLRACIERRVRYVDATASDGFFREAETLSPLALERGVSAVLCQSPEAARSGGSSAAFSSGPASSSGGGVRTSQQPRQEERVALHELEQRAERGGPFVGVAGVAVGGRGPEALWVRYAGTPRTPPG